MAPKFQNLPNQLTMMNVNKLSKPTMIIKQNRYKTQYSIKFIISRERLIKLNLLAPKLQILSIIIIKLLIPLNSSKKSYFIVSDFNIVTKNVTML